MVFKIAFLLVFVVCLTNADVGDPCYKDGAPGTCLNIRNCQPAIDDLKRRIPPQICSFEGADPVVCCPSSGPPKPPPPVPTTQSPPIATTTRRVPTPTVRPTPEVPSYDYVNSDGTPVGSCEPLSTNLTSPKIGRKAWDMCVEYQQTLVYPCKKSVSLISGGSRNRNHLCHHNADELIVGGEDADENEFTHMVLLGYGRDEATVQWQCGGSLISDQWVLTAGHCTVSRDNGPVSFVLAGVLRRSDPTGDKVRRVAQYLAAPEYTPPMRYHDIALVKMDRPVTLSQFLVPACVHVGDSVLEDRVLATGWGLTEHRGSISDVLQKVILNKFTVEECGRLYPVGQRLMKQGVQDDTQICYGDRDKSKDTCQGDSGGPIMIKSKKLHCMYVVTGVTSFGKRCGTVGDPAIYTRVSHYVDWIERNVWPN